MAKYTINDTTLTSIADAIRAKGGTSAALTPTQMPEAIAAIQAGGGGGTPSASPESVNFYDYDGTLLYSYTLEEATALSALPDAPTHEGLTFQCWNWSLDKIKALERSMNVGATYITSDGKTRIHIHLDEGRTSPMLGVCPNGTVDVDWGDGSAHDTLTGTSVTSVKWTPTHNYAASGDYVISLTVDGEMSFSGSSAENEGSTILRYSAGADARNYAYSCAVDRVHIGNGVTSIGEYAFYQFSSLAKITIPDGVTSIGEYAFCQCYSLTQAILPNGVTSIGQYAFQSCYSLTQAILPDGVTSIGKNAFHNCYSLTQVTLPDGVTSIDESAFQNCTSLKKVTFPDNVTSIGKNAFIQCRSLTELTIPDGVMSIGDAAFQSCYSLTKVTLPDSVKNINYSAFAYCDSLTEVTIPRGVTSIGQYVFYQCLGLRVVTIQSNVANGVYMFNKCRALRYVRFARNVATIGDLAFSDCKCAGVYDFSELSSVPTLGTNVFANNPADFEIRVPSALYDKWIAATNWSTYASQIVAV